jgi:hypothetical protein
LSGFDRATVVEVEVLSAGSTLDREPGALDRYLGPYRVTGTSGALDRETVDDLRRALVDPGSYLLPTPSPTNRGLLRRLLVLEAGERALTLGLAIDEDVILVGAAQSRGRAPVTLHLSEAGRRALAGLSRVQITPVGG